MKVDASADGVVSEPDIVQLVLQRVKAAMPELSEDTMARVRAELLAEYGGQRVRIPKRAKDLQGEKREAAYRDGLTGTPTEEVVSKHGISRRTLYRLMKTGPDGYRRG